MDKKIYVGTAGHFRSRGLLFPGMDETTADCTELYINKLLLIKTIKRYFGIWQIDIAVNNFKTSELQLVIEIVMNTLVCSSYTQGQSAWLKYGIASLNGKSIEDLLKQKKYQTALKYSRRSST